MASVVPVHLVSGKKGLFMENHQLIYTLGSSVTAYMRIIRKSDGTIWDKSAGAMSRATTWANSAVVINWDTPCYAHVISIPSTLPLGTYDVVVYARAGASPANSDTAQIKYTVRWNGKNADSVES